MVTYLSHNSKESTNPTESVSFEGTYCSVLCSILMQLLGDPPKMLLVLSGAQERRRLCICFPGCPDNCSDICHIDPGVSMLYEWQKKLQFGSLEPLAGRSH